MVYSKMDFKTPDPHVNNLEQHQICKLQEIKTFFKSCTTQTSHVPTQAQALQRLAPFTFNIYFSHLLIKEFSFTSKFPETSPTKKQNLTKTAQ